jgi:hypothetical protein
MKIARITFLHSDLVTPGHQSPAPNYNPNDQRWRGWTVDVRGASVFLIGPEPAVEGTGRCVFDLPRVSCRIQYELDKGETFKDGQCVAAKAEDKKGGGK